MAQISYHNLQVLVADDFSNFRSTVNRMLMDLGVVNVDTAANSDEILSLCSRTRYDVVLCDYNLGTGRNGQHVLEELRFNKYLDLRSIFILVSAESSRNIVMSAYDSAPDDYLMKPITAKMLYNRLERLLLLRRVMSPVYSALEKGDRLSAIDLLIDLSIAEDRYSTSAQKLLGEQFIANGDYKKAEKLYMRVLEVRELDWARLGLARAKHLQGELDQAGLWLEKIVEDNYLYLPAYDVLAENWLEKGKPEQAQGVVQTSVDVSPMSILRQKNLAKLATDNGDNVTAIDALRKVIKLGRLSCYGNIEDGINLARAAAAAQENNDDITPAALSDAAGLVEEVFARDDNASSEDRVHYLYLRSRLTVLKGHREKGESYLVDAERMLGPEDSTIDIEVDHIRALLALDYTQKVEELLSRLQELYEGDQQALEKLDEFLDEPASDANKAMVAEVNREGIELYNSGSFEEALECFDRAVELFPKHIGIQLNIVQALIGKLKANPQDEHAHAQCRNALESIASNIDASNSQYKRFTQLKNMARSFYESV